MSDTLLPEFKGINLTAEALKLRQRADAHEASIGEILHIIEVGQLSEAQARQGTLMVATLKQEIAKIEAQIINV